MDITPEGRTKECISTKDILHFFNKAIDDNLIREMVKVVKMASEVHSPPSTSEIPLIRLSKVLPPFQISCLSFVKKWMYLDML